MDIYLAVQRKKEDSAYKLDFYTTQNEFAVGLTDGLIYNDFNSLVKKSAREEKFPLQIIKEAFKVDVKTANYDNDEDIKRFVMNAIAGKLRNIKLIENDVKYDDFNKILGGLFVSSSLDRLLRENPNGVDLQNYLQALKSYAPTSISLDLSKECMTHHLISKECMIDVFESLPSSIQRVHINLTKNSISNFVKNQLFNFLNKLKQLNALRIYGVDLEATEVKNLLEKHHKSITSLALVNCSIKDDGIETLVAEIQQCQSLEELDLSKNPILAEGLLQIDKKLENFKRTIKLRLFKIHAVQLTNFEAMKNSLKKIMPYHFSSVSDLCYLPLIL